MSVPRQQVEGAPQDKLNIQDGRFYLSQFTFVKGLTEINIISSNMELKFSVETGQRKISTGSEKALSKGNIHYSFRKTSP